MCMGGFDAKKYIAFSSMCSTNLNGAFYFFHVKNRSMCPCLYIGDSKLKEIQQLAKDYSVSPKTVY